MILDSSKTTLAYRCPACGKNILSVAGVFRLSGDLIRLKCDCGCSLLEMRRQKENRMRLRVPCVFCGTEHSFTVVPGALSSRRIVPLPCPFTGMPAALIGEKNTVLASLKEADEQFLALLHESGFEDFDQFRAGRESMRPDQADVNFDDEDDEAEGSLLAQDEAEDAVRYMLAELLDEGNLRCGCTDGAPDLTYSLEGGILTVQCKKCGSEAALPLGTGGELARFLQTDRLELEKVPVIDFDSLPFTEE